MARFKSPSRLVPKGLHANNSLQAFRDVCSNSGRLASSAIRGPVAAHKLNSRDFATPRLTRPALSLPASQTFCSRVLPPASNATTRARSSASHRCSNNKLTQNCSQTTAHELPDCSSALKIDCRPRRSSPSQDRVSRNTYNGAHSLSFRFPQQAPRRIWPKFIYSKFTYPKIPISGDSHLSMRPFFYGELRGAVSANRGSSPTRTSRLITYQFGDYQQDLAKEGAQHRASRSHERNARATVVQLLTSSTPVRLRSMPLLNQQC
jgi:hypothetical protein